MLSASAARPEQTAVSLPTTASPSPSIPPGSTDPKAPLHPQTPATAAIAASGRSGPRSPAFRTWDPRRFPGWAQALLILLASRLLVAFVVYRAARTAPVRPGRPRRGYWDILNAWDGTWYERTVTSGYPEQLPLGADGAVAPNTWAFYPIFPRLTDLVMHLTGMDWSPSATVVNLGCAAAAVVLLRKLVAELAGPRLALWTVALLCFFPSAAVLQLPYAESPAILLLVTAFWLLHRHRYWFAVPVLLLIGLTRPVAVPMTVVLTVHLMLRLRESRRLRGNIGLLAAWAASGVAAIEWPLIAWYGTGVPDAYTRTMAGWRTPHEVVVLRPWLVYSERMLGQVVGPVVLVAALAAYVWWLTRPRAGIIGTDLRVWSAAYVVYLLAVLESFTSLPRYLLPLFPLGTLLAAQSSSRAYRITLAVAGAILGVIWILAIWRTQRLAP